nr:TIGR04255 family protein [uncultured Carboxylicivirga sp.]
MFGFPQVQRKIYKNNFLRTIVFQVQFAENKTVIEKSLEIKNLFKEEFPRANDSVAKGFNIQLNKDKTPILQSIPDARTGIDLRSEDGQKVLNISTNSLTLTVGGKVYKSFEIIETLIKKLNQVFELCDIKNALRLSVRKVNIIEFEIVNSNHIEVLQYLLSQPLLSNLNAFPDSKYINQSIQTINYKKDLNHLNLRYGMALVPNTKNGQVIVDIDLIDMGNITIDKILNRSKELNSQIFSIFNWTLSNNAKDLLDGKS